MSESTKRSAQTGHDEIEAEWYRFKLNLAWRFNRHFTNTCHRPRPLEVIGADLDKISREIMALLGGACLMFGVMRPGTATYPWNGAQKIVDLLALGTDTVNNTPAMPMPVYGYAQIGGFFCPVNVRMATCFVGSDWENRLGIVVVSGGLANDA
ncbi:MAG: hypothetical protein L3K24_17100 [Gammaproteobacteria bacterium]|nr:hypothetical protein [Gammaproteobacteria bacterium]